MLSKILNLFRRKKQNIYPKDIILVYYQDVRLFAKIKVISSFNGELISADKMMVQTVKMRLRSGNIIICPHYTIQFGEYHDDYPSN